LADMLHAKNKAKITLKTSRRESKSSRIHIVWCRRALVYYGKSRA
jgi:hypothetical protein